MDRIIASLIFFLLAALNGFLVLMMFRDKDRDAFTIIMLGSIVVCLALVSAALAVSFLAGWW